PSSATLVVGIIVRSEDFTLKQASSIAVRTACKSVGGVVTCHESPKSCTSSAPASATASVSSSSSADLSTSTTPLRSNCHDTAPGSANEPPLRLKMFLISADVRFRLSVSACTITATPLAAYPSYETCS